MSHCDLTEKHCQACEGGIPAFSNDEIHAHLQKVSGWAYDKTKNCIQKTFQFKGFLKTMSFVNAVAWLANAEGHHPDLQVTFNTCTICYQTHAVDGITENDFICAAKIDALGA